MITYKIISTNPHKLYKVYKYVDGKQSKKLGEFKSEAAAMAFLNSYRNS